MKKIAALLTAAMLLTGISAGASFSDVDAQTPVGRATEQLARLKILSGNGDGTYSPNDTLTREQFAKIAVCMLGEEKSATARKYDNVFSDVTSEDWSSGYINYIADRNIINGYPNGAFGKEDTITYAQALTVLVRLLGYDGEDVSYRWPDGYISKAEALGICDGITFGTYEYLTRGNAAYLVYNTLLADKKEGADVKLMSSSSTEDVIIYADYTLDASMDAGSIATTKGTFKLAQSTTITDEDYGKLGTLYTDSEQKAVAFVPERETVRDVTVSSAVVSGDNRVEINYIQNGQSGTESFSGSAQAFEGGSKLTMASAAEILEAGREARLVYSADGSFARMLVKESKIEGPKTVLSGGNDVYSLFAISQSSGVSVVRDGKSASLADIKGYDVVYYMRSINTVYAYKDKIVGTYEEAYPNKASVTSVKVAGNTYKLSTQTAIAKLNESADAAQLGDRVTLLLGRNGDVVDAVKGSATQTGDIGVLTSCYISVSDDEDTKGESTRYITLTLSDGSETTYKADKDYTDFVGSVMKISFNGEIAVLSYVQSSTVYGTLDKSARTLGSYYITEDCEILELVKTDDAGNAVVNKINLRDIDATSLTKDQVLYVQKSGGTGDITFLYLNDVTKTGASFGVVSRRTGQNNYTILCDGKETTVKTALALSVGEGVEIKTGNTVSKLTKLASGSVQGAENGRIRVNSQTFTMSDYVKIYGGRTGEEYTTMSVEELTARDDIKSVTLYSDKTAKSGGIVRVITVVTK